MLIKLKTTSIDFNLYDGSVAFEVLNSNEEEYKEKYNNQNDYENLKFSYESLGLLNSNKFRVKNSFPLRDYALNLGSFRKTITIINVLFPLQFIHI